MQMTLYLEKCDVRKMHDYYFYEGIKILQSASIPVAETAYGFSIHHPELRNSGENFAECGIEHDSSVSLSVRNETPPIAWFFRVNFCEMANFILRAYKISGNQATRTGLIHTMRDLDKEYLNI
jgi:hypothetical protein